MQILQPSGWPRPKGYANGVAASGRLVFVAGQIGWDAEGRFPPDFAGQFEQTLHNIVAVLKEAGAGPEHLVRLTWYITDKPAYVRDQRRVGEIYRNVMGRNFPTMAVVIVAGLVEDAALVEIEATAVLPGEADDVASA
ncbi:MAG: RidA family protein [Phenylobacterium sp.]|uniref:RidA family protein n=1 Tax=Phenylobacterium sp. TaxID=1871053 RepID=UPI00121B32E8|nr:RidA family protein [Phenylobacterium sp.]TAJ73518.1 MAG: RidA family protein [Phenylobacterium sp.]